MLNETFASPTGECAVFYEVHEVHWNVFDDKWWRVTHDMNP